MPSALSGGTQAAERAEEAGRGERKGSGPRDKDDLVKEVLSDPVLVDLEEKIKAAEANKRQLTGLLNDQMAQRMRNIEERRQKMRDRHLVYQQRRAQENAERAMDVNAANARAADAAAQHGLQPGAGVWQGTLIKQARGHQPSGATAHRQWGVLW